MNAKDNRINWSDKRYYDMLVDQRKFMWPEDMLDVYAHWFGLKPGMAAVDVGCGLGYLGYTYWPYFGKGGSYSGVDDNSGLLHEATAAARDWAIGGTVRFYKGNAYGLPFPDGFADWTMCQTLLMHLEEPEKALAEMIRVTKPGGLITCNEPDNFTGAFPPDYNSLPNLEIDEQITLLKSTLISHRGRIKLGRGDNGIGAKLPRMMSKLGLENIAARQNDRVRFLTPPYDDPRQRNLLEMIKKGASDDALNEIKKRWREDYVAGGGSPEEFEIAAEIAERNKPELFRQLDNGEFYSCGSGKFYIVKGRKPE